MHAGELDAAQSTVDSAPFGSDEESLRTRLILEGEIETERALLHKRAEETDDSVAAARRAVVQMKGLIDAV